MLALTFTDAVRLRGDYPRPKAGADDVLIAIRMAGVCRTDLEIVKGYMHFSGVMGHEFVGTVVEGPPAWRDKRVVGEINCVCSQCELCRSGLSNHCSSRTVIGIDGRDGAFAEFMALPAANLHEVPQSVRDEEAVFVEPLAAAFQIVRQVQFTPRQNVIILGDGRLGQLVARVMKLRVDRPVLVGKHPTKLEAAEKQGIQAVSVEDFTPAGQAEVVIDATGTVSGLQMAIKTVQPRGTIVLKSTFAADAGLDLAPLVINEVTVVGSRCGPFGDALGALSRREVDVSALISKRFPLREGLAALDAAKAPGNIKVLIDVGS